MAKTPSKSNDAAVGKPTKPKQTKTAAATKRTPRSAPKEPVGKTRHSPRPPARETAKVQAVSSIYDTAAEIISGHLQPTIDQIKSLALAVIGQEEKKARKAQKKAAKAKKPAATKTKRPAAKSKKKK